ncbi:isocitrate/isopropylmalate dehydrogenase family protein [Methermicoccus shengliensis]|uniref:Isocitrate/isopropylmalate dehydrogenase family protein n=1 Tax=Methermicoccus shengliensis TaxID=660064 RepID=A0A832VY33_9EURY|nr:isocitrate/isopropylmalate dehydrogenase family protein [Methermicoccus shengliensis]KUK04107.1 MAG: 3-isopropylmalate dehydrogenase [Euryarchaeota archaeon 55_53]MDI3487995.1 tartrate dehydrogenase/decarboxylase / D-malate dehydrogenase [Methanosarcinales archaeon]MDN5295591.1 tartrate dehydrogenase/decarboxylase / D-malate dehydrogenase [Methanosarcinales archaeon]HIH70383.1 isocitrate/isopropylmalate dehydrogenase family protein [Methermicoccus shengliensis]
MTQYRIPVIPGDGIGPEIIREGRKVIDAAGERFGFDVEWIEYPHGADHYLATGELMSEDTLKELSRYRAIYFGSIGDDRIRPGILEKGILLATRFYFDQYVNLRPVKLLRGVPCPLKDKGPEDIDFVVVRENTEDFYVGIGARTTRGATRQELEVMRSLYSVRFGLDVDTDADEIAYQIGVISRQGTRRVIEYAFQLASQRDKHLSSVDKANVLTEIYGFWREQLEDIAKGYPDVRYDFNFVDAITMWFVKNPEWFDVVVTPNMFGDIITDLGAMIQGGLGLAPGGNINPEGTSMFEPIHGSAPKYKGMNRANPIATIWAGAMMMEFLGEKEAATAIVRAIEESLLDGRVRTFDMGGSATTSDVGDDIARRVREVNYSPSNGV